MRQARLARYVRFMAGDFYREKGLAIAFILTALTIAGLQVAVDGNTRGFDGPDGRVQLARFTQSMVTSISLVFFVIGFNGVCSFDRTQGFGRFYFAKPVDPAAFYGLKWVVHALCLASIIGAWLIGMGLMFGGYDPIPAIIAFGLRLVLYGGILFLLSTLVAAEVAVFSGLYLSGQLATIFAERAPWAKPLVPWVFPWLRLGDFDAWLKSDIALPVTQVAHVVGVGMAAVLAAVVLLRVRRVVT